jgi:hypothetical protein
VGGDSIYPQEYACVRAGMCKREQMRAEKGAGK